MMNRTKALWITGAGAFLAAVLWWAAVPRSKPAGPSPQPAQVKAEAAPPPDKPAPPPVVDATFENEAAADVQRLTRLLRDYRTIAGDNPIGSNAEIVQALSGDNPKQAKILPGDLPLNSSGELVDRWGTPYFFHQLSRTSMEIRSAGSDRRMWTSDDVITR